jgi:hypothetical protein
MTDAELSSIRYSGSFKNIPSIEKVLAIIKANTAIDYSVNGNTVNITRNNNND